MRRRRKSEKSVHEVLSEIQTAYSVFVPRRQEHFHLFQVIFLLSDRPKSPRNTNANLRDITQDLQDDSNLSDQAGLVKSFQEQFDRIALDQEITEDPVVRTMSKESLLDAGFTFVTPGPSINSKASKYKSIHHKVQLSWRFFDMYTGKKLRRLIWKHGEEIFLLIIQQLDGTTHFPTRTGDRELMGIVTKRIVSVAGVSRLEEKAAAGSVRAEDGQGQMGLWTGVGKKKFQEVYDNMNGVSGLHFILFRVECLDRNQWRFYQGGKVCDLESEDLHQALRWRGRAKTVHDAGERGSKTVTNEDSTESQTNANDASVDGQTVDGDLECIDVVNTSPIVPFVDIDITPFLSEFANKQCKLAVYYRKNDEKNSEKSEAVALLRSALRKCRFESTVRALYDLSGCYRHGIGVQTDVKMAGLLRYCAGGMRSNYDTRARWLKILDTEIGLRHNEEPELRIGIIKPLSCRRLFSLRDERTKESIDEVVEKPYEQVNQQANKLLCSLLKLKLTPSTTVGISRNDESKVFEQMKDGKPEGKPY